jgi:head-tail adaptor
MAIPWKLLQDIKGALSNYTYTQHATLWRNIPQRDGIGGITMSWVKVKDFKCVLKGANDNEQMISETITQVSRWSLVCPTDFEIRADDRVYINETTPYMLGEFFEVFGSDYGKTDAIAQNVDMILHQTGA